MTRWCTNTSPAATKRKLVSDGRCPVPDGDPFQCRRPPGALAAPDRESGAGTVRTPERGPHPRSMACAGCSGPGRLLLAKLLQHRLRLRRRPVLGARVVGVHVVLGPAIVVAIAQRAVADVVPTR